MNKQQAGSLGGKATVAKHGRAYMRQLAVKGAAAFHARYHYVKHGTSDFLIVDRQTRRVVATLSGDVPPWEFDRRRR